MSGLGLPLRFPLPALCALLQATLWALMPKVTPRVPTGRSHVFIPGHSLPLFYLIYQLHNHHLPLDTYHLPSITITHHQYPCLLGTSPPLPLAERIPPVPRHARSLASARGLPAARSRRAPQLRLQDGAPAGGQACPGDRGGRPRARGRAALHSPCPRRARPPGAPAGALGASAPPRGAWWAPARSPGASRDPQALRPPVPCVARAGEPGCGARLASPPGAGFVGLSSAVRPSPLRLEGGCKGGEKRLRSRPRPPPLQLTRHCPCDPGLVPRRREKAARLRGR